ncbi:MAG: hypothetical protein V3V25_14645 [Paracoccaceae bacterium]
MTEFLIGFVRILFGGFIVYLFGRLGVSALVDKKFRIDFLKPIGVSKPSKIWLIVGGLQLAVLWVFGLLLLVDGAKRMYDYFW